MATAVNMFVRLAGTLVVVAGVAVVPLEEEHARSVGAASAEDDAVGKPSCRSVKLARASAVLTWKGVGWKST